MKSIILSLVVLLSFVLTGCEKPANNPTPVVATPPASGNAPAAGTDTAPANPSASPSADPAKPAEPGTTPAPATPDK